MGTSPGGGRGARVHANILKAGFGGRLFAVNPKYDEVLGTPCFPSLDTLPEVPDCAVLAVNAEATLELAQACADLGVSGAIALASGFAEAGVRGLARQQRLSRILERGGLAWLGPNGIGGWNVSHRFAAFSPPLPGDPRPGGVAVVSQSGGLLLEIANPLIERGVGLSHLLSTGNEAGTTLEAFAEVLLEDPAVTLVVGIVESFHRPRALSGLLARAAHLRKPVVVLKVGRSAAGSRAAASHTGALAQDDRVVAGVLEAGGAIVVDSTEQLIETVVLFTAQRDRPLQLTRPEAVLVSTSGGRCSLLGDLASRAGLPLATLASQTVERLRAILPDFGTPNNPLDPTGVVFDREGVYAPALRALADDPGVGMLGVFQVTRSINARDARQQTTHRSVGLAAEVVEAAQSTDTPLVAFTSTTGGLVDPQVVDVLQSGGVPLLLGMDSAVRALAALVRFSTWQPRPTPTEWPRPSDVVFPPDGLFDEYSAKRLLARYGLMPPQGATADTFEDAAAIAERVGYPLVVKACGPRIAHKSELGFVRLNVSGPEELRAAVTELRSAGDRVLIERMLPRGVELILGARASEFGPLVIVGSGGVLAELVDDVALSLAPLNEAAALALIERTRAARLLHGYRGQPTANIAVAASCLARLSQLICDYQDAIAEIDVNPLIVTADGAFVADALVRATPAAVRGTTPE